MKSPLAKEAYAYCITKQTMLSKEVGFGVEDAEEKNTYLKAALNTGNRELIDFVTQIKVGNNKF